MGEQIRDKITPADCLAYAEACEQWSAHAPNEAARQRLLEMARSWRELERHMAGTKPAKSGGRARSGKGRTSNMSASASAAPSRSGPASRRSH